jgi:hypothetical protein
MTKTDREFIEDPQTPEDMISLEPCPHNSCPASEVGFSCNECPYEEECLEPCSDYVESGGAGPDACSGSCGEKCCGGGGGPECCGGEGHE